MEIHNIRAALEFGLSSAEPMPNDRAARLAAALLWFWCVSDRLAEGMTWLEKAEKLKDGLPTETQAKVLDSGGELAWLLGEEARGRAWLEESTGIWRAFGDERRVAYCLQALSFLVDPELGREQAEESMAIFRSNRDEWGEALALHTLGMIESQRGCLEEGRARLEEGLRRYETLGDAYLTVQVLNLLGDLDRNEEKYEFARKRYEAALAIQGASEYRTNRGSLLQNLGFVSLHLGDIATALDRFREAVELFVEQGDSRGVAEALIGVAAVLTQEEELERAATLAGAAETILARSGATLWRSNRDDAGSMVRTLKARLGDERFAALTGEGASLGLQEAVGQAFGKERRPFRNTAERDGSPLTPREQEVAALVAKGYRNREIAEALVISEGTATLHVKHILRRLGFSSRSEIAAWAAGWALPGAQPE